MYQQGSLYTHSAPFSPLIAISVAAAAYEKALTVSIDASHRTVSYTPHEVFKYLFMIYNIKEQY